MQAQEFMYHEQKSGFLMIQKKLITHVLELLHKLGKMANERAAENDPQGKQTSGDGALVAAPIGQMNPPKEDLQVLEAAPQAAETPPAHPDDIAFLSALYELGAFTRKDKKTLRMVGKVLRRNRVDLKRSSVRLSELGLVISLDATEHGRGAGVYLSSKGKIEAEKLNKNSGP